MAIRLRYPNLKVFYVKIFPHDFLWFASFDSGAISITEPVVHNYALSYAISNFNRVLANTAIPTYEEDLEVMNWYTCPAKAIRSARTALMWNAIDTKTQTTEDPAFEKANTPKFGTRHVLVPWPATVFETYIFSKTGQKPPRVIRLGKKRAPCVLESEELNLQGFREMKVAKPTHLVNPLDTNGTLESYRIVTIMPSLLVDEAVILDAVVFKDRKHWVLIPKRLLEA